MKYLSDSTLVHSFSLHGWTVTVEFKEGFYFAVVQIPYKESSDPLYEYCLLACDYQPDSAVDKLSHDLLTIVGVLRVLNPRDDQTANKIIELMKLMGDHSRDLFERTLPNRHLGDAEDALQHLLEVNR